VPVMPLLRAGMPNHPSGYQRSLFGSAHALPELSQTYHTSLVPGTRFSHVMVTLPTSIFGRWNAPLPGASPIRIPRLVDQVKEDEVVDSVTSGD